MMNELGNLFPSGFQCGLRILVVQDDETCNQVIEQMLKSWDYQVTISRRGNEAISLLRENKGNYDIVISDFPKPDMDGLKFLKIVGLKMNLPVLVIIGDESRDVIIKGIENGVCQYLVKPIRRDDLRHIWQHVVRKKRKELKEQEQMSLIENSESQYVMPNDVKEISTNKDAAETSDIMKRRRDGEYDQSESCDDVMRSKKTRLAWTKELHETFVTAVNELGVDMAVPKKILEFMHRMGISDITRENIASHLQKYRMNLKRTPSSDYTSSVGPSDQHYSQQSYAFNEMSRIQAGASTSCQVPITSPRVSQENQYFNANSSLFGRGHINHEFDKMRVVVSGYEMDQQFNNNETLQGNLVHRYSNSNDMRHQLILSSKQQDPTLSSLGAQINNPIYANPSQPCMLNEIEAKNKMLCGGIEEDHESCGYQMYAPSLANGTHDHDQAAFVQNVTPLAAHMQNSHDVVTCYPNIEMSQHGFPLHHANSIEHMVYKNESPISKYSLIDRDHDFGNLGNINVQHYNKNLFQNHGEYHHGSSSRLSCDISIHVKQQSLDLDDYMTRPFIEESSELAQNRTTSNGYPTDNVQI